MLRYRQYLPGQKPNRFYRPFTSGVHFLISKRAMFSVLAHHYLPTARLKSSFVVRIISIMAKLPVSLRILHSKHPFIQPLSAMNIFFSTGIMTRLALILLSVTAQQTLYTNLHARVLDECGSFPINLIHLYLMNSEILKEMYNHTFRSKLL